MKLKLKSLKNNRSVAPIHYPLKSNKLKHIQEKKKQER
jgi:hypothetical protein